MVARKIISYCVPVLLASGVSFYVGKTVRDTSSGSIEAQETARDDAYDRGLKLGGGRHAWHQAAYGHGYMRSLNSDIDESEQKALELAEHGMWFAIIDLDEFIRNNDASATDRQAASRNLAEVVLYFRTHPIRYSDPETQSVLDRLIKERHFPGRMKIRGGISVWMPRRGGSGWSYGDDWFEYDDRKNYEVTFKNGRLKINGISYGSLSAGDELDLRDPGYVYVNSILRESEE